MPPVVATVASTSKFSPDTSSTPPVKSTNIQDNSPAPDSTEQPERGRSRVRRPSNHLLAQDLKRRGYHTLTVPSLGKAFHVEKRFKLVRELGHGAYGTVISAQDEISGEHVAIKQVARVFEKISLAKRALREIMLLRQFANHDNITGLIDMDVMTQDFNEIYLFMEPMEADLHQIIRSEQGLTNAHVQYFIYQILRGLKFIHSAGVIHRDLKPGNLLVNSDCELKICDFGLSRGYDDTGPSVATNLTEYVATRWYRAPEIMLSFTRYGKSIDIWSVGCILGELLNGKPMFKGRDYVDQLNKIIDVLGTPPESTISAIKSERAQKYVRSLPVKEAKSLPKMLPKADVDAIDLLSKVINFNPEDRLTVSQALEHPWLASFHDQIDEPDCPTKFEGWTYIESLSTIEEFREAIWNEVQDFRKEVRNLNFSGAPRLSGQSFRWTPSTSMMDRNFHNFSPEELDSELDQIKIRDSQHHSNDSTAADVGATDPILTYGDARRASTLQPVAEDITPMAGTSQDYMSASHADGPAVQGHTRTRTSSMIGGRLLRSLSTISVHEVAEDSAELVSKAAVGKYIGAISAADAPPSELPKEFM